MVLASSPVASARRRLARPVGAASSRRSFRTFASLNQELLVGLTRTGAARDDSHAAGERDPRQPVSDPHSASSFSCASTLEHRRARALGAFACAA